MRVRSTALVVVLLLIGTMAFATGTQEGTGTTSDEPVVFSLAGMYPLDPEDAFAQALYEKLNFGIEWEQMTWDTWNEKTNLWFASGDMPDAVMWNFKYGAYVRLADQEIFREIPEFGSTRPNLTALRDNALVFDALQVDGGLYTWPRLKGSNHINDVSVITLAAHGRYLEQAGYGDQDVFTLDEFRQMLVDLQERVGPTVDDSFVALNGPTVYIPDYVFLLRNISPYFNNYVKVDGEYVWGATLPETLEAIQYAKSLYDAGVLPEDFYAQANAVGSQQFSQALSGVVFENYPLRHVFAFGTALEGNVSVDARENWRPIYVRNQDGLIHDEREYEFWASMVFSPSSPQPVFDKITEVFDWLVSDEGTKWGVYGIPGVDWNENADGSIDLLWEDDENGNPKSPGYASMFMRENVRNGTDLAPYQPDILPWAHEQFEAFVTRKAEVLEEYGGLVVNPDYALDFLSTPNKDRFGSFSQEVNDEIVRIIISGRDIEAEWAAFIASMEDKVQVVLDEINAAL